MRLEFGLELVATGVVSEFTFGGVWRLSSGSKARFRCATDLGAMSTLSGASRGGVGGRAGSDSRILVEGAEAAEDAITAARQQGQSREQVIGR